MSVKVNKVWFEADCRAEVSVFESFYDWPHYMVWLHHMPSSPPGWSYEQKVHCLEQYVLSAVVDHLRRGELPPGGMQIMAHDAWGCGEERAHL